VILALVLMLGCAAAESGAMKLTAPAGAPALAVGDINITFTHALPVNLTENAQIVRDAAGANAVSVEMAVKMLHHGENWTDDDVKQEVERIQAQKAEEARSLVQDDFETVDTEE
jgi:hypothetical protein